MISFKRKKQKKALIIGVSGQDGAYLAKFLLNQGYEVHGTSRDHEVASFRNLIRLGIRDRVITSSLVTSDFRSVLTVLQRTEADEIYNLAGQTSVGMSFSYPVETFESILIGTINLLECLRLLPNPGRFYNAGSSEVFGNTPSPATEKTPFNPRSPYAAAKAAAHYAVANYREAYGLFACTGILFNHESSLRPDRFVTQKIISSAVRIANGSKEKLKLGSLKNSRDWGWAPEYVTAMWQILTKNSPDDFVIATGEKNTLKDFVAEAFRQLGLNWEKYVIIDHTLSRPTDIYESFGNPQKAKKMLNWKSKSNMVDIIKYMIQKKL